MREHPLQCVYGVINKDRSAFFDYNQEPGVKFGLAMFMSEINYPVPGKPVTTTTMWFYTKQTISLHVEVTALLNLSN